MLCPQERQGLVVTLFERRKEVGAERFHLLADLTGLCHQQLEADQGQRLVQAAHDRVDVKPLRSRPHEEGRVDRRVKQGQFLEYSLDV